MFTYAQAEAVLARLYGADPERQKTTLRARLKHFKKLGVPFDSAPGKGAKVLYDRSHILQWAMCLELSEAGLDPTLIVRWLRKRWPVLVADIERVNYEPDEAPVLTLIPRVMSRAWGGADEDMLQDGVSLSASRLTLTINLQHLLREMAAAINEVSGDCVSRAA